MTIELPSKKPRVQALLQNLLRDLSPGIPVTSAWLQQRGISAQMVRYYAGSGWLERLAHGYYVRPSQTSVDVVASLRLLVEKGLLDHVGGKTALAWGGFRHNVSPKAEMLILFGRKGKKLPSWFLQRFSARVVGRRLFNESPDMPLYVGVQDSYPGVPFADPERAVLELLSDVPQHQSLEEAEHLMQGMVSLRVDVLRSLLKACRNVKAVRLFLHFARSLELPCASALAADKFPVGSSSRYVRKLPHGTLIIKP
jgi:hypothetical protein